MSNFDTINFLSLGLSNENWRAFSDGGELQWINDVELLSRLAVAYHSIQMVKLSSSAVIRYRYVEKPRTGHVVTEHLESQLATDIQAAITNIQGVIRQIGNV
jgi:hypothetical protein